MTYVRIALIFAALCLVSSQAQTGCKFKSSRTTRQLYDLPTFQKCASMVAFDAVSAQSVLDTLHKVTGSYVFVDIVKNSPISPLAHFQIDIMTELASIATTQYANEWDFQQAVANVYTPLKDPHTLYTKPSCFGAFALQPFGLMARYDAKSKSTIIYIDGIGSLFLQTDFYKSYNLQQYIGATINLIDGQDAYHTLLDFSEKYGYISKDAGAAFNSAVSHDFQQSYLRLFDFPSSPVRTFSLTFSNGTQATVSLPFSIFALNDLDYSAKICNKFNNLGAMSEPKMLLRPSPEVIKELRLPRELQTRVRRHALAKGPKAPLATQRIAAYPPSGPADIEIYNVSAGTLALKISTFSPTNRNNKAFLDIVNMLMTLSEKNNVSKLILDMTGNGGGDICLGYQVIRRLVSEEYPEGNYDIIHSPMADAFVDRTIALNESRVPVFSPQFWAHADRSPYTDESWYMPGEEFKRGGSTSTYSERVYHACDYPNINPKYDFNKIIVISDGLCGSTCAVFTNHLDEVEHVDTLAFGGIYPEPMQYFSFPGGQVLDFDFITQITRMLNLRNDTRVPKPFPYDAGFRFAALEIYPWLGGDDKNLPLEFRFRPADFRLPLWVPADMPEEELIRLYGIVDKYKPAPPAHRVY